MNDGTSGLVAAPHPELFDRAPCGLLITTPDDLIVSINQTLADWTGFAASELIGRPLPDLLAKGSQLFYETRYMPVLRLRGEAREIALDIVRADSSILPVLLNAVIEFDTDDRPSLIRIALIDSTERQDYERELLAARKLAEASEVRLRVLQQASITSAAATDDATLAAGLSETARVAFAARAAAVLLIDDAGEPRLAAGTHPLMSASNLEADVAERAAIASGGPVFVGDLEAARALSPTLAKLMRAARLEAMSVTPVPGESGSLGLLTCFFGRARDFDEQTVQLQNALALQAGLALRRLRLQRQLLDSALHDQLTGLANRRLLSDELKDALKRAKRSGRPLSVIFIDLDRFKPINDTLGHTAGDSVLLQVADRLRAGIRDGDMVGRFGGDEFVIVCEGTDVAAASVVGERLREAIAEPLTGVPSEFFVTASIGVASYTEATHPGMTSDQLVGVADAAMYRAKETGNRVTQ
jgi:diguanylate cyclase (GGDEF)-like protein/PAS domain S-box-containing protein